MLAGATTLAAYALVRLCLPRVSGES
jgi:hypothetical protein